MRSFRLAFALLMGLVLFFLLSVDVLPGQDLPQHLATARIMMEYGATDVPFQEIYQPPSAYQTYFTMYWVLVGLGRMVGLDLAFRILIGIYAIGVMLGFDQLVKAVTPKGERWASLLSVLLVWNPIAAMGFWAFMFGFVLILFGAARFTLWRRTGRPLHAIETLALAAATAMVHVVAAGCLILFCLIFAVVDRSVWRKSAGVLVAGFGAFLAASMLGEHGLGSRPWPDLAEIMRSSFGLEFINHLFQITWYDPTVTASYVGWAIFGPYRWGGILFVMSMAACLFFSVKAELLPLPASRRQLLIVGLSFFAIACLVPWGLHFPSEITFINARMIVVGFALVLAFATAGRLSTRRASLMVTAFAVTVTLHLGYRLQGFDREAEDAMALIQSAEPKRRMQVYAFRSRSMHFGKVFRVAHFLPAYYTVERRGISAQFWGRFTDHLPVAHRAEKRMPVAPTFRPWEWQPEQVEAADYVLIHYATEDEPKKNRDASRRMKREIERMAATERCEGDWCLYRVRGPGAAMLSTLRSSR